MLDLRVHEKVPYDFAAMTPSSVAKHERSAVLSIVDDGDDCGFASCSVGEIPDLVREDP